MLLVFFFFKQKTAYEMRISDWSSDVCSSDLAARAAIGFVGGLVDDVAQVVEAAGVRRTAGGEPVLAALPALPCAGGEAEDFGLDPAAFERAHEDVGADRGDADRPTGPRAAGVADRGRSEERREGDAGGCTCKYRGAA